MDQVLRDLTANPVLLPRVCSMEKILDDVVLDVASLQLQGNQDIASVSQLLLELRDSLNDTDELVSSLPVVAVHDLGCKASRIESLLVNHPVGHDPGLSHYGAG